MIIPVLARAARSAVCLAIGVFAIRAQAQQTSTSNPSVLSAPRSTLVDSARARLATLDGDVSVRGLEQPVEVRRDRWGVPHIYARTQHDLFFAQGYVAAQDRLWQMEMWRRQGEGRLAEVLGSAAVARDRYARLFKYRGDMAREWASYAPDAKAIVTAFVDGVNAYIREVTPAKKLPIEFSLMGFAPEPWTPEVALIRVTPLSGTANATSEVLRARLVALVGAEKAAELLPTDPQRPLDPAPGLDLHGIDQSSLGNFGQTFGDIAYARVEGSNNWVVSGAKTKSGKPILANDPHRAITNPAVRYITHLVAPGWNVIGAGEPGSPGVSIGHNDRIAFGLTIAQMDQQDVYVEEIASCERGALSAEGPTAQRSALSARQCVRTRTGLRPIRSVTDTIHVKGEPPRAVTLRFTEHGPVVAEDSSGGAHRAFVVRAVYTEPGTAAYLASLSVDRTRDWPTFQRAMARWGMPSENMIYADVDGNIGWFAGGMMPKRSWSGLLPVPGEGSREWSGFLTGPEHPQAFNPPEHFIATANNNTMGMLPKSYPFTISYEWASRYRIDRIREVLRGGSGFTVEDFERLQHDDLSILARAIVPVLVQAATRLGQGERPEVRTLASWNFRMSRDQAAPLVFEAWSQALGRRMNDARLAEPARSLLASRVNYEIVERLMTSPDASLGPNPAQRRDSIAVLALDDAATELTRRFGADRSAWLWGKVHVAPFRHPLAAAFDLPAVSRAGDANTVFASGGANYQQRAGASYREIIDLGDFDNSVTINVPGQSAQPGSEYYDNLLPLWGNDQYFPMAFSRARVEKETRHVLRLTPAR